MDTKIQIEGLEEIQKNLQQLGQEMAAKLIIGAAYNAAKPMMDMAKVYAPVDTGLLRQAVTRKKIIYPKDGRIIIMTGVGSRVQGLDKYGRKRWPVKYAHIVEKKDPFIQDAMEATAQQSTDRFLSFANKKLKKYLTNNTKAV